MKSMSWFGQQAVWFGMVLWLIWTCADDWNHDPNYSYGWLIPPMAAFFLYRNAREHAAPVGTHTQPRVLWLLPVSILVLALELIRLTPIYSRLTPWTIWMLLAVFGSVLAYWTFGKTGLRVMVFPLVLLAAAIPWPTFLEIRLVRELSFWVAAMVGELLLWSGVYNEVQGKIIQLTRGSVGVDEACSGLRSFQAALMVGLAVGEWFRLHIGKRMLLLAGAVLLALGTNLLRAYALSMLVVQGGQEALGRWHDPVGHAAMILLTLGVALGGSRWVTAPPPIIPNHQSLWYAWWNSRASSRSWLLLSGSVAMAFLMAHAWFLLQSLTPAQEHPYLNDLYWRGDVQKQDPPDEVMSILRADEGGYKLPLRSEEGLAYHFFWRPARTNGKVFFHRPDVCMPGGGWDQIGDAALIRGTLNGRTTVIHHFRFRRGDVILNLFWLCWADDRPMVFSGEEGSKIQSAFLTDLIRLGKRVFAVEILGVITPRTPTDSLQWSALLKNYGAFHFIPETSP